MNLKNFTESYRMFIKLIKHFVFYALHRIFVMLVAVLMVCQKAASITRSDNTTPIKGSFQFVAQPIFTLSPFIGEATLTPALYQKNDLMHFTAKFSGFNYSDPENSAVMVSLGPGYRRLTQNGNMLGGYLLFNAYEPRESALKHIQQSHIGIALEGATAKFHHVGSFSIPFWNVDYQITQRMGLHQENTAGIDKNYSLTKGNPGISYQLTYLPSIMAGLTPSIKLQGLYFRPTETFFYNVSFGVTYHTNHWDLQVEYHFNNLETCPPWDIKLSFKPFQSLRELKQHRLLKLPIAQHHYPFSPSHTIQKRIVTSEKSQASQSKSSHKYATSPSPPRYVSPERSSSVNSSGNEDTDATLKKVDSGYASANAQSTNKTQTSKLNVDPKVDFSDELNPQDEQPFARHADSASQALPQVSNTKQATFTRKHTQPVVEQNNTKFSKTEQQKPPLRDDTLPKRENTESNTKIPKPSSPTRPVLDHKDLQTKEKEGAVNIESASANRRASIASSINADPVSRIPNRATSTISSSSSRKTVPSTKNPWKPKDRLPTRRVTSNPQPSTGQTNTQAASNTSSARRASTHAIPVSRSASKEAAKSSRSSIQDRSSSNTKKQINTTPLSPQDQQTIQQNRKKIQEYTNNALGWSPYIPHYQDETLTKKFEDYLKSLTQWNTYIQSEAYCSDFLTHQNSIELLLKENDTVYDMMRKVYSEKFQSKQNTASQTDYENYQSWNSYSSNEPHPSSSYNATENPYQIADTVMSTYTQKSVLDLFYMSSEALQQFYAEKIWIEFAPDFEGDSKNSEIFAQLNKVFFSYFSDTAPVFSEENNNFAKDKIQKTLKDIVNMSFEERKKLQKKLRFTFHPDRESDEEAKEQKTIIFTRIDSLFEFIGKLIEKHNCE